VFYGCTDLTDVTIGSSVTTIGNDVFYNCSNLTDINIPASVTTIGNYMVYGCSSLQAITVDPLNIAYSSLDGVLFNKNQTELIQYPLAQAGSYTIPNSVISIANYAFRDCIALSGDLIIPDGVVSIGTSAFKGCSALTTINIPVSVTSIGSYAFYGCSSLLEITVDALNPFYSSLDGVFFNKDQTVLLRYPQAKTGDYTIPDSVVGFGFGAFDDCTELTGIFIPHGIINTGESSSISGGAFFGCTNLTEITVSELNPSYSSLDGVLFNKDQTTLILYPQAKTGSYVIPDGVTYISSGAFIESLELTSILFPASVTSLGYSVFVGCNSLSGLYFKGDAPYFGQGAFQDLGNAVIYYIPTTIGWDTAYTFGLAKVQWPPSSADADLNYEVDFYDFSVLAGQWGRTDCSESNDWCGWADFDQGGSVDLFDLTILADEWMFGILWFPECPLSVVDFDTNGDVDFADFAIFAAAWGATSSQPEYNSLCDISDPVDGVINAADLKVFAANWLITPCP
jgi:hypothetical protein